MGGILSGKEIVTFRAKGFMRKGNVIVRWVSGKYFFGDARFFFGGRETYADVFFDGSESPNKNDEGCPWIFNVRDLYFPS